MAELTVLFADIAQSTSLFDKYGDDKARSAISSVLDNLIMVSDSFEGKLIKTIGDEIMCTFPNASRAMQASMEMQESVSGNFVLGTHPIGIRIGFHHGKVIEEGGDVYGDTVNVAARMAGFAKKDQIISNSMTLNDQQLVSQIKHRNLGKTKVKGKLLPVKIIEILWQKDTSQVTRISSALDLKLPEAAFKLNLNINGRQVKMTEKSPTKVIGRGEECDLQVLAPMASRVHAEIEFDSGNFRYSDQSTNGTWIEMASGVVRVHRDKVILMGKGKISLGSAEFIGENIINFEI